MGVDWRARNHGEALGLQCLEPQLIGAAGDRRLDAGGKQSFEDIEQRSEEHTSELQSLMRISYAVFCLKKKKTNQQLKLQKLHTSLKHITSQHLYKRYTPITHTI